LKISGGAIQLYSLYCTASKETTLLSVVDILHSHENLRHNNNNNNNNWDDGHDNTFLPHVKAGVNKLFPFLDGNYNRLGLYSFHRLDCITLVDQPQQL
jgi:hypothetical protein